MSTQGEPGDVRQVRQVRDALEFYASIRMAELHSGDREPGTFVEDLGARARVALDALAAQPSEVELERLRTLLRASAVATGEQLGEWEELPKVIERLKFAPLGDNHHNAAACPYCNPKLASPSAPSGWQPMLIGDLVEAVEAYEGSDEDGPSISAPALRAVLEAARAIANRHEANDPIPAAVDAQLDPLKDELIAMGRTLAKQLDGREVTVRLMDTDDDPMLVHGDYPECQIAAPHRGSMCPVWRPTKDAR